MEEENIMLISCWPPEEDGDRGSSSTTEDEDEEESNLRMERYAATNSCEDNTSSSRKRARISCDEPVAMTALAAWARQNYQQLQSYLMPADLNPRSKLYFLSRTPDGVAFLADRLQQLEHRRTELDHDSAFYYIRATYLDAMGDNSAALESVERSLKLSDSDIPKRCKLRSYLNCVRSLADTERAKLWLFCKLKAEQDMKQMAAKSITSEMPGTGLDLSVERVKYSDLSVQQFLENYCCPRKAVVITGAPRPTPGHWTLQHIRAVCGHRTASIKRPSDISTEWAGLETVAVKTVSEFLDQQAEGHYLFDWSLPINAPDLAREFLTPKYFLDDLLKMTAPGALYRDSWPSLFIGPKGTKSGLHIDAFGSHFWMYLVSGRKQWTFYPAESAGMLGPVFVESMDPVFRPGQLTPQLPSYSLVLEPGEILFVPSGSPHKVENLEDSVAVSGNFVNNSNKEEFLHHVRINGLLDPRSVDLLQEMLDLGIL